MGWVHEQEDESPPPSGQQGGRPWMLNPISVQRQAMAHGLLCCCWMGRAHEAGDVELPMLPLAYHAKEELGQRITRPLQDC